VVPHGVERRPGMIRHHAAVPPPPHVRAPETFETWLREPYRALFPLGAGLAVLGVLPFALLGAGGGSLAAFHSVAQILGFLTCFVVGFLMTFIPRRTRAAPPRPWQLAVALLAPAAAAIAAWGNEAQAPYLVWLALVAVSIAFVVPRMRRAPVSIPAVLVWVPLSLLAGAAGAALVAAAPLLAGAAGVRAWVIGRGLLTQGFVAGLVLGVGGVLVPQLTRGEAIPDEPDPARGRRAGAAHAAAAALFFASFPVEVLADRVLGMALRAAVATAVLVVAARAHRLPSLPGLHRRLVWLGAWLVAAGFWAAALFPAYRTAALHVVFVGGFAQIALAVGIHVTLSHGGRPERLSGSPVALRVMAALLAVAFVARLAAGADVAHVARWLAVAGVSFIGAVAAWAVVAAPALRGAEGEAAPAGAERRAP
jgi:uncharacterized protein involved in response to NO